MKKLIPKYQNPSGVLKKAKEWWKGFKEWGKTLRTQEGRKKAARELEPVVSTAADIIPVFGTTYRLGKRNYKDAAVDAATDIIPLGAVGKYIKFIKKANKLIRTEEAKGKVGKLLINAAKKDQPLADSFRSELLRIKLNLRPLSPLKLELKIGDLNHDIRLLDNSKFFDPNTAIIDDTRMLIGSKSPAGGFHLINLGLNPEDYDLPEDIRELYE